jgi:EAL domain-containing protein (putative c-di-GMP-specific phosphodiesterase class I)
VVSTASIGIVVGDGSYERAEDALRDADTAMYEAKHAGKACYVVFDASMRQRVQRNMRLENELRRALADEAGQLSLVYQPIVSLQTGELCGVEALLRWQHPDEGNVSPREFIPIAEESGLSARLSEWVIGESCRQLRDWTDRLGAAAPGRIAINLSRKQFLQPDLPDVLAAALESCDIAAERLQLEIAENALGRDLDAAIDTMKRLKETGVRIAIDHFGNECSSFASLHEFPVDVVKIDNSLLKTLEQSQATAALIHSLSVLARNLGIVMMAEGVERPTQVVALQELGCHYGQGYYFSAAAAADEIESQVIFAPTLPYCVEGTREFQDRWSERLPALKSMAFDEPGVVG